MILIKWSGVKQEFSDQSYRPPLLARCYDTVSHFYLTVEMGSRGYEVVGSADYYQAKQGPTARSARYKTVRASPGGPDALPPSIALSLFSPSSAQAYSTRIPTDFARLYCAESLPLGADDVYAGRHLTRSGV
eukprot:COSAG01_NODE_26821_length_702_cov_1.112769_2_plen_131_part_01